MRTTQKEKAEDLMGLPTYFSEELADLLSVRLTGKQVLSLRTEVTECLNGQREQLANWLSEMTNSERLEWIEKYKTKN